MVRPWYVLPFRRALCMSAVLAIPSGCSLDQRAGDGLVTDGRQIYVEPSTPVDAGGLPVGDGGEEEFSCKHLDLFVQKVVPQFEAYCTECHAGQKADATEAVLEMSMLDEIRAEPDSFCKLALFQGASEEEPEEASMLTASDPNGTNVEHDFHFDDDPVQFMAYREELLPWLRAEKAEEGTDGSIPGV